MSPNEMQKTPLNAWHIAHRATMVEFNGWHMPLYYTGITEEHNLTRTVSGAFDLCHMGRVILRGSGARDFVDQLTPAHMRNAKVGDVLYSFLLDDNGCTIDDITIYVSEDQCMLVVNAGGRQRDVEWIKEYAAKRQDVEVEDASTRLGMIAIQGPESHKVLAELLGGTPDPIPYYGFREIRIPGSPDAVIISNTGYTGERGYEIYSAAQHLSELWDLLFAGDAGSRLRPIGLGARDSLRLEAAMPLYGHELDRTTNPLEAGLGKFVDWGKPGFVGREALLRAKETGLERKLVGFEMSQRGPVARQGHEIEDSSGSKIGIVTSGIFSPTLQKTIGMAYIQAEFAEVGREIQLDIRGRKSPARMIKRPFYKRRD